MGELKGLGTCELAFGDNEDRLCAWCGQPLEGRRRRWCSDDCSRAFTSNHLWSSAREAALSRDLRMCVRDGCLANAWRDRIEVNHKTPILGRHGEFGCHHHLDGLETLCRAHHLEETRRQFGREPQSHPIGLFEAPTEPENAHG